MTVREDVVVGPEVRERLGEALGDVLASLWTMDCQTCNRSLTGHQPALSVDDMMTFASASLHHIKVPAIALERRRTGADEPALDTVSPHGVPPAPHRDR
ncbi:hypothetical protein EV643_13923 [Kribbella sp. VKM Ac-2527]|uniref:Uncharacterized protein n=1 Tax=Kribbella caucasensis TaxID=2512215 RepID=A0A4R6J4B2_9ACTN|nr:hypothetical protein [Kribbella sp. VKM Ac-2527]TDO30224.1 hypothetical protein EV643_13923 [Kribbella sp. VKM Ac-2527]